jgi:hypothetical protein
VRTVPVVPVHHVAIFVSAKLTILAAEPPMVLGFDPAVGTKELRHRLRSHQTCHPARGLYGLCVEAVAKPEA